MFKSTVAGIFSLLATTAATEHALAADSTTYLAKPPFLSQGVDKPNVVISLDVSGSMTALAYPSGNGGNSPNTINFDPATRYFGYFTEEDDTDLRAAKYTYQPLTFGSTTDSYFVRDDANGNWDGNFLNWLSMRRIDVVRKVLVGGKVRDRAGETDTQDTRYYIVQPHSEFSNRDPYTHNNSGLYIKASNNSSSFSPIPDDTPIYIERYGAIGISGSNSTPITNKLEIGSINVPNGTRENSRAQITFTNSYNDPVIIASIISSGGGAPATARVISFTTDGPNGNTIGATLQVQEYPYLDGTHAAEAVSYIVAERGAYEIPLQGGGHLDFVAGYQNVSSTSNTDPGTTINFASSPFSNSNLNVFTGVSSNNDADSMVTRIDSINSASFRVEIQRQKNLSQTSLSERIDFLAIEKTTEDNTYTASGLLLESKSEGGFTHINKNLNFSSGFSSTPFVVAGMISKNGPDTANVRYRSNAFSEDSIQLYIDEDESNQESSHTNETIGYLAVSSPTIKLQIAKLEEPRGIIQERQSDFRFGAAVYNFDHTRNDIYNGNTYVHGGTLYPCYPEYEGEPRAEWECKRADVRAPINNIIDIIEDHPLIWGATPIAETMYDIWGYFRQHNFSGDGQPQYYANGSSDEASYVISDAWDPYKNDNGETLSCTESYVLNFNDGAPFNDFDGNGHPSGLPITNSSSGLNESLDEVALKMRITDARPAGANAVDGFQAITSYYIYGALGSNEQNNTSTRRMREAAARGGFKDLVIDGNTPNALNDTVPANFINYFNPGTGTGTCDPENNTAKEWDTDGDCNPDGFFFATDGDALKTSITNALDAFALASSSGGAASLVSTTTTGAATFVRGLFSATGSSDTLPWAGDVNALMVDKKGLLRVDGNNDGVLDDYATDKILDTCYSSDGVREVKVQLSDSIANRPSAAALSNCTLSGSESDIEYLWSAKEWLSDSSLVADAQRVYGATEKKRHIFTWLDNNTNDSVDNNEVVAFLPSLASDDNAGLFNTDTETSAENIIRYTRGEELNGFRNRTINNSVLRLGDNIYSTPTPVARPAENIDLLYKDASYLEFVQAYRDRRQVIYAGTNDGMLHAFNGGYYNRATNTYQKAPGSATGASALAQYDLGAEIWAYIPYNLLPHLKYLSNPTYGQGDGDHLYMMDQQPRIFDAKIFCENSESTNCLTGQSNTAHPNGWGTVLVAGMRLGGGAITVDPDNDTGTDNSRTLKSAYVIMDITNPEAPPKLLKEFTHADLGFTTSEPTPLVVRNDTSEEWYMAIGSGPSFSHFSDLRSDSTAKLFLLNLKTMALVDDFGNNGVLELAGSPKSFVGDILAVDYNLDFTTDSLYFGTIESNTRDNGGNTTEWGGDLYRLNIQNFSSTGSPTRQITNWAATKVLGDTGPIAVKPAITFDNNGNRWLLAGTGRFYNLSDAINTSQQFAYGLKEPRNNNGGFTLTTINADSLLDVTNATVNANSGEVSGLDSYLGSNKNVTRLDSLLQRHNTSKKRAGWKRSLGARERILGSSALLGGTLSFTPYAPPAASCTFEGDSFLYSLRYTTGTAWFRPTIGVSEGTNPQVLFKRRIGSTPVATVSPHAGKPGSKKITQNTQSGSGEIIQIETDSDGSAVSRETDWRQL